LTLPFSFKYSEKFKITSLHVSVSKCIKEVYRRLLWRPKSEFWDGFWPSVCGYFCHGENTLQ